MGENYEFKDDIAFPADAVLEKMLDMQFIEEWTLVQKGLNPQTTLNRESDDKAVVNLDLEEPLPKPLGTVKAHMKFVWDIPNKRMAWTRDAEGLAAKAKIYGTTEIVPKGDNACQFVERINIEIPIPVMGRKFEKIVGNYLKAGRPEKILFLKRKLGE